MRENEIARAAVHIAVRIHRELGPGLLESVYQRVMATELRKRGYRVSVEVPILLKWDGEIIDNAAFRADLIVEGCLLIELKSVEALSKVHRKQIQTYLRLTNLKLGLLLNFGGALMKDGIVRAVNGLPDL